MMLTTDLFGYSNDTQYLQHHYTQDGGFVVIYSIDIFIKKKKKSILSFETAWCQAPLFNTYHTLHTGMNWATLLHLSY